MQQEPSAWAVFHTQIVEHGIKTRHGQKGWLCATSCAVQLLASLPFTSCLLSSFQGDTSNLLRSLIETNSYVLIGPFCALIQPASWLLPKHVINFSSIRGLSRLNKPACLSWMNFLGSPSRRVFVCLPKDGELNKRVECWHVSVTA